MPSAIDPRRLDRLYRRLHARECDQAVVQLPSGKFDLVPSTSPRLDAMMSSPSWSSRVLGVFSPEIDFSVLCEELA